jgi:acyl transferase domain-containing protein/NAD(P)-dependent dehydrogenase (short-subunit alcohol dehydrogenase family)/NADPH:quinone reductase-like Zn-dependent oxidoreductase/acyl carrier protein
MPGGIQNPDDLWQMISAGRDGVCEVPRDRWDWRRYYSEDPDAPGKIYVRSGGFLQQDIRQFDAEFFGISPREAMVLDPQQRLLLETSWEAIDDAGLSLDRIAGTRTGVYIGALTLDNMLTQMSSRNCQNIGPHSAASSTMTMLSNRLSYFLDLHGPSLSIDTACSSSLVAFHLACQSLWNGESEMALVGAVNVMFCPEYMMAMCKGQFLAPDGRSKSFDQRANGYGRGEGAGVLIVKPLETALANGDRIYALVRATGCNQDGKTNGITVPNPEAQKSLILSVLEQSEVPPSEIHYVEAHGTGTPIGDPIEAQAIGESLGCHHDAANPLVMGSIKSNLGHLEAASGVAGLIKLCMCYKYGAIPPVANLGEANPAIPFDRLGLRLPRALEPLSSSNGRTFLAINSFGYGGTNAHAILENPPAAPAAAREESRKLALLPISARSEKALRAMAVRYRDALAKDSDLWLDLCAAAALRRTHHNFRAAFAGTSCADLIAQIDEWLAAAPPVKRLDGRAAKPVFVFSGMGPQWWGMGQQLFEREPVFAESVTRADAAFQAISGWSVLEEMRRPKEASRINQTIYAQPAIFVLQAGLVDLLRSWGVEPTAVIGHSLGENASAYASGALTLEQAVRVGFHRSQILARAAGIGGGMLAVGLTEEEAEAVIAPYGGRITIAAINAPKAITLAGESEALTELSARLTLKSVFNRALQVEVAYHSAFMDPLQQPLVQALAEIHSALPKLDTYSTVTGAAITERAFDGPYWARNIRQSVQFLRALEAAIGDGHRLFLEIGAHPVLSGSIRECVARNNADVDVVPTLARETDECLTLYKSLAALYAAGCNLDWTAINGAPASLPSLPSYPWQRETYWEEMPSSLEERVGGPPAGLAGRRLDMHEPVWERYISNRYLPYIDDHVVQKLVLLPGAAMVDAALSLHKEVGHEGMPVAVEDVQFKQPLVLDRNADVILRTAFDAQSRRAVFYSKSPLQSGGWTRHADLRLSARLLTQPPAVDTGALQARLGAPQDVDAFYAGLTKLGLQYGPNFRRITELRANSREVLAKLTAAAAPERYDIEHVIHPALLDCAFQSLLAAIEGGPGSGFVPASIEQVAIFGEIPAEVWCYGEVTRYEDETVMGDLRLLDQEGRVLASVTALRCARVALPATGGAALVDRRLLHPAWRQAGLDSAKRRTGSWLVLAEGGFPEGSFAAELAERLRLEGCERVVAVAVANGSAMENEEAAISGPEEWGQLFSEYPAQSFAGVAYVTADPESAGASIAVERAARLLELFRYLPRSESQVRAYLVTERAQAVEAGDLVDGFRQASAAGFFRVAYNEYPGLLCTAIDHDGDTETAAQVAAELLADDEADDVAWRSGVRYTQRVEPCTLLDLEKDSLSQSGVPPVKNVRYTLAHTASGLAATGDPHRDLLYWKQDTARGLAADEIEIEVAYCQIERQPGTRRDTTAHELTRPAWREFSGRITRAGSAVKGWRAGDAIAAAAFCQVASHVIVRESDLRATKLRSAPAAGSASLAISAASVNVALRQMARAKQGESVLVVSAAHDDMAQMFAVSARLLGLHAIAAVAGPEGSAAGSDAAPLDLRSDEFERLVLAANHGRPLDIVVFCGAVSPALHNRIPLAFGGRVVLHGPAAEAVDPARFLDASAMYSVHRVHPSAMAAANAPVYQAALAEVATSAPSHRAGSHRVCPADALPRQVIEELRSARSVCVDMSALPEVVPSGHGEAAIDANAAYVITGGFGGFGLAVADYLIAKGARHIVLAGRSGATTDDAKRRIAAWREQGVTIREALLDIANSEAVDALFAGLSANGMVKGIMHSAGLVDDARIGDMTREQLARVMRPKVDGAWNLHVCSLKYRLPLDHFVLFSSAASIVGNGGQANYVAANAVLDSMAAYRRARGLAGTSINWGALAEVGMATDEELRRQFQLMGIFPFSAGEAMSGLDAVLRFQPVQIGIMDVDWVQWGKFEPTGGKSPRFAHLTGKRGSAQSNSLADSLRQLPAQEQFSIAELMLAEQVAKTLRMPAERIDVKRPLTEMGIDSLMAVELQIAINVTFGVEFSALELTRGYSISQLTAPLLERMGLSAAAKEEDEAIAAESPEIDVDSMSEAELDALILAGANSDALSN